MRESFKIEVQGRIHLGHQRELVQGIEKTTRALYRSGGGITARHKYDSISADQADSVGQSLKFSLSEENNGELFIENAGLVTSFGIFGAPGSGKTVMLNYLLEQVFKHEPNNQEKQYGALILDPKASLAYDIYQMAERAGRVDDLRFIGTGDSYNVIDCTLDAYELGSILVLAARSAGIGASDPFWFQEWSNLFSSCLSLLRAKALLDLNSLDGPEPVSLKQLLDAIFNVHEGKGDVPDTREIQHLAAQLKQKQIELGDRYEDILIDIQQIERFFKQDYVGTIEAFITKAYGMFRQKKHSCFSTHQHAYNGVPFYEDIIENGRIVVVSIPPSQPALAKTICTLIKCLFQRTVLARADLYARKILTNKQRPVVLACDEYSEIASEVPGQSMGDGQFLALARQYGCMAILATQSVNVLQASSLNDSWKSVFSNFAAKIYMRLVDNETAEEATKLAGESDWRVDSRSISRGSQGSSSGNQKALQERKNLPSTILTQVLKTGEAVVIGALDGGVEVPGTRFVKIPYVKSAPVELTTISHENNAHLIRSCPQCAYYNKPDRNRIELTGHARIRWEQSRDARMADEHRRVQGSYAFDYQPEFYEWCSKRQPSSSELITLNDLIANQGIEEAISWAEEQEKRFDFDPVKGEVKIIYEICESKNREHNCPDYKDKKELSHTS